MSIDYLKIKKLVFDAHRRVERFSGIGPTMVRAIDVTNCDLGIVYTEDKQGYRVVEFYNISRVRDALTGKYEWRAQYAKGLYKTSSIIEYLLQSK